MNRSLTIGCFAKALIMTSIMSASAYANEKEIAIEYCQAPINIEKNTEQLSLNVSENNDALKAIEERGLLRILLQQKTNGCILSLKERQLIEEYASINNLEIDWVYVEQDWQLLAALLNDDGDIILGQDQSLSANMHDEVRFSHPWANASYKIVARSDNSRIKQIEDLAGRQVAAYQSSPIWNSLVELSELHAGLVLQEIPSELTLVDVMERVKSGEYDLAVADSLFLESYLPLNTELQADFSISDQRNMAWVVKNDAEALQKNLNQYLNQQYLTHNIASTYFEDLSLIKERGILRVITTENPSHYYLHKGKLRGFEYELLNQFASKDLLRIDVVLANSPEEMFQLLEEGKGDVIAATLPTSLFNRDNGVEFTEPYHYASPVIVGRDSEEVIVDVRDLEGRRITLSEDSPYWDYMSQLKEQGMQFELVKADVGVNMEGTLLMVALGMYDLTVVGSHQMSQPYAKSIGLSSKLVLSEPLAHRWVVRSSDKQLANALNTFIENQYRTVNYNVLHAKYFEQRQNKNERVTNVESISPYDDVTKLYSEEYGFDWRLVTALMFQESQFNPTAYSDAGAEGLMQLIPATAELMGVSDTSNAESSINAGIRYLDYLRNKFEEDLLLEDRMWFTLASYNAGYGRVKRARALAVEMGLDKNVWFDNVELAMMELAKPFMRDGEQVRYCRCGQTVVYVREIRTRYFNYIRLTDTRKIAGIIQADSETIYIN